MDNNTMTENSMTEDGKALAIMAHDLKAPLAAIVSILGLINKGYVTDMVKTKELVERASHKAETLITIVDDILDYTLLSDKSMMKREMVDLVEILLESIGIIKPYADDRGISISYDRGLDGKKWINGNYTFLLRAFNNIIMNAIKYNKKDGKITIDSSLNNEKNTFIVTVTDTGIGIPKNDLSKVFKIFERGRHARRNVNGSLGLGLSLVKQIIEEHYGKIEITSTVGVGTTITVTLPLIKEGGTNES